MVIINIDDVLLGRPKEVNLGLIVSSIANNREFHDISICIYIPFNF